MARKAHHRCPECQEPVYRRTDPFMGGWALAVPTERLMWQHRNGEPLCPVVGTDVNGNGSYVPALPQSV